MTRACEHNPDLAIVEATIARSTSAPDLQECTSKMISIDKEAGINRSFVDTREMSLDASLPDVHQLPAEQYIAERADGDGRLAVILWASRFEHQTGIFCRDACHNRRWDVEAFTAPRAAPDWLTGNAEA